MERDFLQPHNPLTAQTWDTTPADPLNPTTPAHSPMMPEIPNLAEPSLSIGSMTELGVYEGRESTATQGITPDPTQVLVDFFKTADGLSRIPAQYAQDPVVYAAASRMAAGDFSGLPAMKVMPSEAMAEQLGYFDPLTGAVYLSEQFLKDHISQPLQVTTLVLDILSTHPQALSGLGDVKGVEAPVQTDPLVLASDNAQYQLQSLFAQPDWLTQVVPAFGDTLNSDKAKELAQAFLQGEFSLSSLVKVVPADTLAGARAAYDQETATILISEALTQDPTLNPEAIADVLLEEFGHYLDAQLNGSDAPGDEGQIFAAIAQGKTLTPVDLAAMQAEEDHALLVIDGQVHRVEQSAPNFAIQTEGTFTMNGSGDLDGEPLNLSDDALVYAAKGFTINGNPTLPVQRDAQGNVIKDASGKPLLVLNAVTVSPGYTVANGPSNKYAGLNPPMTMAAQTVTVPAYADLRSQTLTSMVPTGTPEVVFDASRNSLNSLSDWNSKFPASGTATQPRVVRVKNGGLNIPASANLSNTVIIVESGDINFNGNGHTFTNVTLIANNGNINLNNVKATDLAGFASGSINMNGSAKFTGMKNLLATNAGSVTFNGSTKTTTGADQIRVISQGNITFNGSSHTRGSFTSKGTFTLNGASSVYGSIGAKNNVIFNGNATVIYASITTNQAPTALDLSPSAITENVAAGSVIGDFSTTDPDANNTFTYSLVSGIGDADNAVFSVVGNQLKINASPDFEAKSSYSVRVRTTDQGGLFTEKVFTVNITNVNEAPTNLALSNNTIAENSPSQSGIGTLTATDPDQGDRLSYELVSGVGDTDNAAFAISGNQLQIKSTPDFEVKSSYTIRVRTTDLGGLFAEKILTIQVADVNEAPTQLHLSHTAIGENNEPNGAIGQFSTVDPDANNTHTYQFVTGTGDADNAAFSIVGNELRINTAADFETKSSYSVRVRTTDQGGLSFEQSYVIQVHDLNEAPIRIDLSGNAIAENASQGTVIGQLSTLDPDLQDSHTYTLVDNAGGRFQVVGNQLQVRDGSLLDFESASAYSIAVQVTDAAGLANVQQFAIALTNVNEAPTHLSLSAVSVGENATSGTVLGELTTTDPDVGDSHTYTLVDDAQGRFQVVGNQLQVKDGTRFDLTQAGSHTVAIQTIDAQGLSKVESVTITVIDTTAPQLAVALAHDTAANGLTNTDGLTSDPTLQGQIFDNRQIVELKAWFGGQSPALAQSIQSAVNANGQFQLTRSQLESIQGGLLSDGQYTLNIEAVDAAGNRSAIEIRFTLDTTAPAVMGFMLAPGFDTAPIGDARTTKEQVILEGQADPHAQLLLVNTGVSVTADATGRFQFTEVPLALGPNALTIEAVDAAGNRQSFTQTLTRDPISDGDVVVDWNRVTLEAIRVDRTAPPKAAYIMALIHAAVFDAVNAVANEYQIYQVEAQAVTGTSAEAAAAAAAFRILMDYFPFQQAMLNRELAESLADIPDGLSEDLGVALGTSVANQFLIQRQDDGSEAVVAHEPSTTPGIWRPTPANYYGAALPQWPNVVPFALIDGSQFRPDAPPALDSEQYAAEYNQVKELGSKTSTTRTAEQTEIAFFWADGPGTYTPPGHWNQIAGEAAIQSNRSLIENARLFALLNLSLADAGIAAWDTKYTYNSWRPITAIQQGAVDGNPLTTADPNWQPLIATPPFPAYVSGHSTFSAAASTILADAFGDHYGFTTTTFGLPGVERQFTSFSQAADEAGMSRIYGGIHFMADNTVGLTLGRNVAGYVLDNFLKPINASAQLQAGLAHDTAPAGGANRDQITADPTISGQVSGTAVVLKARLNQTSPYEDVSAYLSADGQFTLTEGVLAQLNQGALGEGLQTVYLQAWDAQGLLLDSVQVSFILDRTAPTVTFAAPLDNAIQSPTAHLKGQIEDAFSRGGAVRFSLDGQPFVQGTADGLGQFDQMLAGAGLSAGEHQINVEIYDAAGNFVQKSVAFFVSDQFSVKGEQTQGWGIQTQDALTLFEGNSLLVQKTTPIQVGIDAGTRTVEFTVNAAWDQTDVNAIAEDRLVVYLVNPANPSQTLLDGGEPGSALFSLSGQQAEYRPGLVRFDGQRVILDVSSLPEGTTGNLVFQLLNLDGDTGSSVRITHLTQTVDPEGISSPVFPVAVDRVNPGNTLPIDSFLSTIQVKTLLSNVRVDEATGQVIADLRVQNIGDTPVSRQMAVVFPRLPEGVTLLNPSGTHANGSPYLNLTPAMLNGDLAPGALSEILQVTFSNADFTQFDLQTVVLTGQRDLAPQLADLGTLTVVAGGRLEIPLTAIDLDGDRVTLSLRDAEGLPTGRLENGKLIFLPSPTDVGTYTFTLVATSNGLETTQAVTLNVQPDPVTTTRISGVVQDTNQMPLAGVLIDVDGWQTVTGADGSFTIELPSLPPTNTLRVHGQLLELSEEYPFIAEKLPLMLEHEVYAGVNNVIARPIYLPPLDIASGQVIDPSQNMVITSNRLAGAAVTIAAGSLKDQSGLLFRDILSITEVPVNLTPAALPENLKPDLVVTIQPGDMVFTTPALLTLPNNAGYAPGMLMDLWSINPITGQFDNVGTGQVSADGSVIETISGGVRNSSWHFFAPFIQALKDFAKNVFNLCMDCPCPEAGKKAASEIALHSGTLTETHNLVSYQSLGKTRGLTLTYDSLRADPRPIVHFGYDTINPSTITNAPDRLKLLAKMTVSQGDFEYQVPGYQGSSYGLTGGEHIWSLPATSGKVDAALQVDLRTLPSGQYDYSLQTGIHLFVRDQFLGSSTTSHGQVLHVNGIDSIFGNGWGLAGLQELIETPNGSIMLVDGDGGEMLFQAPLTPGATYQSPMADFSTLKKLADGTFERTMKDQTVYRFNSRNQLSSVRDRNGNETRYIYDGEHRISKIIDPVGLETTLTYTNQRVSTITDPAGRQTQLEHDQAGNLIRVTDPDGQSRTWQYDTEYHMTGEIDKEGNQEQAFYNFAGRATGALRKDGSTVQFDPIQMQGLYRPDATINPLAAPSTFILGAGEATDVDGNGNLTTSLLNQTGQVISSQDSSGQLSVVERNMQGLVSARTDAKNHTISYEYDQKGNLIGTAEITSILADTGYSSLFPNQVFRTNTWSADLIAVGDINGDGTQDVVSGGSGSRTLSIALGNGDGTLKATTNIELEGNLTSVALADLNGDGKQDLLIGTFIPSSGGTETSFTANAFFAAASQSTTDQSHLSILMSRGDGNFDTPTSYQLEAQPEAIHWGDVDNDGDLDVIINHAKQAPSGGGYGEAELLATAEFTSALQTFSTAEAPLAEPQVGASILLNSGTGTFSLQPNSGVTAFADTMGLGDLNRDGVLDLVTIRDADTSLFTWFGNGDGTFGLGNSYTLTSAASRILLSDLNGDGNLDVVAHPRYSEELQVLLGSLDGTLSQSVGYSVQSDSRYAQSLRVVDENQDGVADLLFANNTGRLSVLRGNGDGSFGEGVIDQQAVSQDYQNTFFFDLDGDNLVDLLKPVNYALSIRLGKSATEFEQPSQFAALSGYQSAHTVALANVVGDANPDLVIAHGYYLDANEAGISILTGQAGGTFGEKSFYQLPKDASVLSMTTGDLDQDGYTDIYTTYSQYGLKGGLILFGSQDSQLTARSWTGANATSLKDVNGDGRLDAILVDRFADAVQVYLGTGNRTTPFEISQRYAMDVDSSPSAVVVGDMNGDLLADLVVANSSSGTVSVLLGNGDGTFSNRTDYEAGDSPNKLALGDLNGDNRLDLVVGHSSNAGISILLGNSSGTFETPFQLNNRFSRSLALGDVDGNQTLDIVTANLQDISVYLGNGDGTFASEQVYGLDGYTSSLTLADIGNDNRLDVLIPSGSQVTIGINGESNVFLSVPKTVRTSYTYDSVFNKLTSSTDELGRQTLYEIDPNTGNVLSMTRVVGAVGGSDDLITSYTYTANGLVDLMTDPMGEITDYDYDAWGRLTQAIFAKETVDQATIQMEYDAIGNQTAFVDENGNRTAFQYDALNRLVKVMAADPDGAGSLTSPTTTYVYDAAGNPIAMTDARGNASQYQYDPRGRLIRSVDSLGGTTLYQYDHADNLIAMTDSLGRTTQYRYDGRNRRIASIDPAGAQTLFTYDANDNVIAVVDALGNRTTFVYDQRNRLTHQVDALGRVTQYGYDAVDNLIAQMDAKGHQTSFTYDALDRLIQTTDALGGVSTAAYDKVGNVIAITDALGRITQFDYDHRDRLVAVTDPLNGLRNYTYDKVGNLLSVTDELRRMTTYEYDALNRQISVSDPLNHTTSFAYDAVDNLVSNTDALGRTTQYGYDALNRLQTRINPLGNITTTTYDAVGNVLALTDELDRTTQFTYDERDLRTSVTDALGQTTSTQYDAVGNVTAVIDPLGQTTRYGYDALYRQTRQTDALGQTTTLAYDAVGNLLSLSDPENNTTAYTYDALDRRVTDTNALGHTRRYTYDAVGNQIGRTDRNGRQRQFTYDALDRQTQEIWVDGSGNPLRTFSYTYDAASQLSAINDPDSAYAYTYDLDGRLTSVDNAGTFGVPNVLLSYTYDAVNNLLSVTDTIAGQVSGTEAFTYDALNRVTRITQSGTGVAQKRVDMAYDAASQMTGLTRYADLAGTQLVAQTDYGFDQAGRLTNLTHSRGTTTIADYGWIYDAANRIIRFTSNDGTSDYNYDDRGQVVGSDHSYQQDEVYSYDDNGNRTNPGYQTGGNNRLLSDGTYTYAYDPEGNRTTRTEIATGEVTEYLWDYRNRLTEVVTRDSAGSLIKEVAYAYDVYDRRIEKTVDPDGEGSASEQTERFVYDGEHIALVFDGQGNQTHRYLHEPQIDQVLAEEVDAEVRWALADNQGTVRDVIDTQGNVLNHINYDSFGQVISETSPDIDFRFGYTGRELDAETGQYYYRARYYDASVGRFVSEDPIGFGAGDANLYRYVFNSPTNFTDPSGLSPLAGALPVAGGLTLIDGPLPVGDIIAGGLLVGAVALEVAIFTSTVIKNSPKTQTSEPDPEPPHKPRDPRPVPWPSRNEKIEPDSETQNIDGTDTDECDPTPNCPKQIPTYYEDGDRFPNHVGIVKRALEKGKPDILTRGPGKESAEKNRDAAQAPYRKIIETKYGFRASDHGLQYDEYPYASTREGGKGAYVELNFAKDNQDAGRDLGHWLNANVKRGCKFRVQVTNSP